MDEDFDELGNYVGTAEYSDSGISEVGDGDDWEDASDGENDNALVKSVYGPNVEVAHYKHDTQDASKPLVAPSSEETVCTVVPTNWAFHKGLMDSGGGLVRDIAVVGHVNHGKSSFVELFTGTDTTDAAPLEKQRNLTLQISCHTLLAQDTSGKSYVLNIVDTPGHPDFDDEVHASRRLADNSVLVVDVVEGPLLSRFPSPDIVVVNKLDRLILDLRLPPDKVFDRLRVLVEDELKVDPKRVIFMSTKFRFAFTLQSFATIYAAYQEAEDDLNLWNAAAFTSFILEPLYKLFSCGLVGSETQDSLDSIGIRLSSKEWQLPYDERIQLILARFFEDPQFSSVVDVLIKFTNHPPHRTNADPQFTVAKRTRVGSDILSLVKVNAGILTSVQPLLVPFGASVVEVESVHSGNWALIKTSVEPFTCPIIPLVKIGIEPLHDSLVVAEKYARGLETLDSLFAALNVQIMETGEYCMWGTGELYLDCVVHVLKELVGAEFRISQPCAELRETVSEQSYAACPTTAHATGSSITVLAYPLPFNILNDLAQDKEHDPRSVLRSHGWSMLDVDTIMDIHDTNILSDDNVPPILDSLNPETRDALVEGFRWACNEGPLMEARLRGVHFKIMECSLHGIGQLVPTMRRACHAAMFVASPRIMEPWMRATVVGRISAGKAVYSEVAKRRGNVDADKAIIGTNLYETQGVVPLMDSFGLEIDILCNMTQRNEAQVSLTFDSWRFVNGNPLDTGIAAPRLKPADDNALARDYMVKTRRRKGLLANPQIERYLDESVVNALK